jgi:hypothetical protein
MQRDIPHPRLESRQDSVSPEEDVINHFSKLFSAPASDTPGPDTPFRVTKTLSMEMRSALSPGAIEGWTDSYPKAKSAGPDRIHARVMKVMCKHSSFAIVLSRLFRHLAMTGLTPEDWNNSRINLLPKTKEARHVTEFRPVSLTSMLRRCFESLWLKGIVTEGRNWMRPSHLQAGFCHGYSTLTHASLVDELAWHPATQAMVFIDVKSTYDLVPIVKLLDKLEI